MIGRVAYAQATAAYNNIVSRAPAEDTNTRSKVQSLESIVEKQNLLLQTLLMILLEKKVIYEDEFREWMDYVDELDGVRDGKLREDKSPRACPSCGRNSPQNSAKCMYCGEAFESDFLLRRPPQPPAAP